MKMQKTNVALALAVAAAVASPTAFATNGYFAHGYSMAEKGLAGAGVAMAQDSMASATNPAGLAMVGNRGDVGISAFMPYREYTTNTSSASGFVLPAGGTAESDKNLFWVPSFGINFAIDNQSAFGFAMYGNGGMNTYYTNANTFQALSAGASDGTTGVDLAQLFLNFTYARKFAEQASWGVSGIVAYQRFKAYGLQAFGNTSTDSANLTNNGYDDSYGAGAKVGISGQVAKGLSLAASYQSRIYMTEFDKYKGLFAEQGDFDIPATATIGLAWNVAPKNTLLFDIQYIWYSDIASVANKGPTSTASLAPGNLGCNSCLGFGWEDMTVYKLGYQWETSGGTKWRVGYSYGEQPIPSSEVLFNILAPAVMEHHITFGFTMPVSKTSELTFAAMYAPESSVSGRNPVDPTGNQTIELSMKQYDLGLAYSWKF